MLGFPLLHFKGVRLMMFQLSGFYYKRRHRAKGAFWSPCTIPRGSMYTTIMELDPQNHSGDGLSGPNSIMVVYMDPLGNRGG